MKQKDTIISGVYCTVYSSPQAPEYTIRAVLNFFENSRRYSQLKGFSWAGGKLIHEKNQKEIIS
jgi:hypothetical protein